jgi:hypothetical protein
MELRYAYWNLGNLFGSVAAVVTFVAGYLYAIATFGLFLGAGIGWLPAGVLAAIVYFAVMALWGPLVLLVAAGAIMMLAGVV